MTTALHAAIPTYIVLANMVRTRVFNIWLLIVAAIVSALPDLINNKYWHLIPGKKIYNMLHRPWLWVKEEWLIILCLIYGLVTLVAYHLLGLNGLIIAAGPLLHIGMDYPYHTDNDETKNYNEMNRVEIACWMGMAFIAGAYIMLKEI